MNKFYDPLAANSDGAWCAARMVGNLFCHRPVGKDPIDSIQSLSAALPAAKAAIDNVVRANSGSLSVEVSWQSAAA